MNILKTICWRTGNVIINLFLLILIVPIALIIKGLIMFVFNNIKMIKKGLFEELLFYITCWRKDIVLGREGSFTPELLKNERQKKRDRIALKRKRGRAKMVNKD